jgi:hypothetical protein
MYFRRCEPPILKSVAEEPQTGNLIIFERTL